MYGEFFIKILSAGIFTLLFVVIIGFMYETAKKARAENNHLVVPLQIFITLVVVGLFAFLGWGRLLGSVS